jgi:hypothetical protein
LSSIRTNLAIALILILAIVIVAVAIVYTSPKTSTAPDFTVTDSDGAQANATVQLRVNLLPTAQARSRQSAATIPFLIWVFSRFRTMGGAFPTQSVIDSSNLTLLRRREERDWVWQSAAASWKITAGEIRVESRVGQGTTFIIILPFNS